MTGGGAGSSQIAPGDLLEVTLLSGAQGDTVTTPVRVGDDGSVDITLVGQVPIAGLDPQVAADRIRVVSIERGIYRHPQVTVQVSERAMNYVTVLGAVTEPGTHPLPRGASNLVTAIAAAGGFSDEAGTEVEVLRQGQHLLANGAPEDENPIRPVAFNAPPLSSSGPRSERIDLAMASSSPAGDMRLADQDVVMVHPARKKVVHVAGLVRQPNQFEMPKDQDLHVLDAIAMAGGASSPVADKVYVIRRLDAESQPVVVQVSIGKAKLDGSENLRLAPGDMVSVEATPTTAVVDTLSNIFRITAGVGGNLLSF